MTNLAEILMEWQNNLEFRTAFKINPELALKNAGFSVTEQDLAKILKKLNNENEQLDGRINK